MDDEGLGRRRLRQLLGRQPLVKVVGEFSNGADAIRGIPQLRSDVVFLDIQMPGVDGFGVAEELGAGSRPALVFVTAFEQHAIRAFEVHAVDYLLKPVAPQRLAATLERLRRQRLETPSALARRLDSWMRRADSSGLTDRIPVRAGTGTVFVPVREIDWIEVQRNHLKLRSGRQVYTVGGPLARLEAVLPGGRFLRIHRSYIVNRDRIREVQPWFHGDYVVTLQDGTRLTSGRTYRHNVQELLHWPIELE